MRFHISLLLLALCLPHVASAAPWVVCIHPSGSGPSCSATEPCGDTVASWVEAVASVQGRVQQSGGETMICLDPSAPTPTALSLDNGDSDYGDPLTIAGSEQPICPPSSTSAETPAVDFVPGPGDQLLGLTVDFTSDSTCAEATRPGLRLGGPSRAYVTGTFSGTSGYAIQSGTQGDEGTTEVRNTEIRECEGAAIDAVRETVLWNTRVIGCTTREGATLGNSSPDGFHLWNSLILGNRAGDSATAVLDGVLQISENTSYVLNAFEEGASLMRIESWRPQFYEDSGEVRTNGNQLANSILSRNIGVSDIDLVPALTPPFLGRPPDGPQQWCITDGLEGWLDSVDSSTWPSQGSNGAALIELEGVGVTPWFSALRSQFVENRANSLIRLGGDWNGGRVQLLHDTLADNDTAAVLELEGRVGELTLLRNLWLAAEASSTAISGDTTPGLLFFAGNERLTTGTWLPATWGEPQGLRIDAGSPLPAQFLDEGEVNAGSACAQHQRRCPGEGSGDCDERASDGALYCSTDRAARYLPSDLLLGELPAWPWDDTLFDPGADYAGAHGWRCEDLRPTFDRLEELETGDGDGFPDAIDCDNDDPELVPEVGLPGASWCGDGTGSSVDDDDDSANATPTVPVGCSGRGCGVAIPTRSEALLLLLLPLGWRQRRLRRGA